jgi:hypothetical protein
MSFSRPLLLAFFMPVLACLPLRAEVSQLWGEAGEKWTPQSRLPDFSFAGYRRGEEPFRIPAGTISVTDFGAKGDGRTDDTAAFKAAIASGSGKVIRIPPGQFVLSDVLEIDSSNLVLRGAGSSRTVLVFTKNLETLRPRPVKNDGGEPTSDWSWGGGLIMIGNRSRKSQPAESEIGRVAEPANRGANQLTLVKPLFRPGDEVVLSLHDTPGKSLVQYLYRGQTGNISGLNGWQCSQVFRIRSTNGSRVQLDRGLRFDVRLEWRPRLEPFRPGVTDVGLEGVAFHFPTVPYPGHFKEKGWNPVAIRPAAAHCWLRDLYVLNGDSGPFVEGATFCTLQGIRLAAEPGRKGRNGICGHHGITLEGNDCLCADFTIETQFVHDLTVQSAVGCVFSSGKAANLCMDHHCWASCENLFTDIDAGEGRRLFASGGGANRGLHTAAGATFWNIRGRAQSGWPASFGPDAMNMVGLPLRDPQALDLNGRWIEALAPCSVQPADLHAAMLARRLAGK